MPDAALLAVSHPAGFLDALILVAGFERLVRCLIPAALIQGLPRSLLARGLGMISFRPEERELAHEKCCALLAQKAPVVIFAEPCPTGPTAGKAITHTAASIAVEADRQQAGSLRILLFPVYLYLPVGHTQAKGPWIDVDQPMTAQDYVSGARGSAEDQAQELAGPLAEKCQANPFRLRTADLADFLGQVENAFRIGLQEERKSNPVEKQSLNGFELSRFVVEWGKQTNYLQPGHLISLRESLEAWRESRRVGALHRLQVERAGTWSNRPLGRGVICLESVAGAAVVVYAFVNHLLALAFLFATKLLKKESGRDRTTEWFWRALVVVGSYGIQIYWANRMWGRRVAGYYAPTLPFSALYLWRYIWLLSHQTRVAFYSMNLAAEAAKTKRLLARFLDEINRALDDHAKLLGLPH